jgi:uncharacterized membrane protein YdbT with pleckstrin-like domain
LQELKKKELDELDAIFSELGISTEEKAAREAAAEKKKKKKEKKKANGEAENGSSNAEQQQQQQPAAAAAEPDPSVDDESGESLDPATVSGVYACVVVHWCGQLSCVLQMPVRSSVL